MHSICIEKALLVTQSFEASGKEEKGMHAEAHHQNCGRRILMEYDARAYGWLERL